MDHVKFVEDSLSKIEVFGLHRQFSVNFTSFVQQGKGSIHEHT